ncbi:PREDICTED: auxilin-related protein 2-like [Camelina sativa]|uniref:Auxilin-related protein 2-like n=1 Tax=Camelina sativa TaxID=90675 RepID=A0ABM0YBQ0_CAMSA|nr:PREDICTED: auxilin-related protein 2-like [Camelina sativa]
MDEFGVLTERYGIKPQGKSAPMAASKRSVHNNNPNNNNAQSWNFATASSSGVNAKTKSTSFSGNGSVYDADDIFFTASSTTNNNIRKSSNSSSGFDDFDGFSGLNKSSSSSGFNNNSKSSSLNNDDDGLLFSNFGNSGNKASDDDLFGGIMPSSKPSATTGTVKNDDLFGSFSSSEKQYATAVDDLLGLGKNDASYDGLIPGFGGTTTSSKTTTLNFDSSDPFVVLESTASASHSSPGLFVDPLEEFAASVSSQGKKPSTTSHTSSILKPPPKPTQKVNRVKSSGMSSIDELEDFAMGTMRRSASASDTASKYREAEDAGTKNKEFGVDDLDSFFSAGHRSSSVPKSRTTTTETSRKQASNVPKKTPNGVSNAKKPPAPANLVDDFSALFGEDPIFRQFEEIPGESEERRKARWDREQRTKSRVAQAVADMNNRDHQSRIEQEQRTRISETVDTEIRRWATGKEGNMRALLSSLQIVLWPGCGWEAVSLTDLITSSAVKKVYRKATLYVHPDKVQQKGATLEQKYIAEKVFDILKEAWNKFNKEELS